MNESVQIGGLLAATFTPVNSNGEMNLDIIPKYVDHLVNEKVDGVFVGGTSGESVLFTVEERKKQAVKWITSAKNKLKHVIIHVGCESIKDTQELAKHAQDNGATCIAVISPVYFTTPTPDAMGDYLQQVYQAASTVPMLYYHIPITTHTTFSVESVFHAAKDKVPTLVGAKISSPQLGDVQRCIDVFGGKYQIFYGGDEMFLGACAMGCTSAVGSTYNFSGSITRSIVDAFKKGDLETARKYQAIVQALCKIIVEVSGPELVPMGIQKAVLTLKGVDVGPPRAPYTPPSQSQLEKLKQGLESIRSLAPDFIKTFNLS